nr:unnamed protein product [Naegleria fowleri]
MPRNRLEQLYEDEFDGFIEFEDEDQKLEMLREEQALLEFDDDEIEEGATQKRPLAKHNKKRQSGVSSSTTTSTTISNTQQNNKGRKKKQKQGGEDEESSSGPKLPLKYRRIAKYTDKQIGFHVLHQSLSENNEFNELALTSLTPSNEKTILLRRLNIYLDTLHDWCRTIFPDLSFDEALAFMESQSFSNRVHQSMEWGRSTFSSRYQKAVQAKEQRKRKRTIKSSTVKSSSTKNSILDEMDEEASGQHHGQEEEEEEQEQPFENDLHEDLQSNKQDRHEVTEDDDNEMHDNKEIGGNDTTSTWSPYKSQPYSKEDGEEEFRFEDYNNDDEEEDEEDEKKDEEEPSPKKKKPSPHDDNEEEETLASDPHHQDPHSEQVTVTTTRKKRKHSRKSAAEIFLGDLLPSNRVEAANESSEPNASFSQSLIPSSRHDHENEVTPLEESLEI